MLLLLAILVGCVLVRGGIEDEHARSGASFSFTYDNTEIGRRVLSGELQQDSPEYKGLLIAAFMWAYPDQVAAAFSSDAKDAVARGAEWIDKLPSKRLSDLKPTGFYKWLVRNLRAVEVTFYSVSILAFAGMVAVAIPPRDGVGKEYTWTRTEPAAGRRTPTEFRVRVRVDEASGKVVWLMKASDADGEIGSESQTWSDCTCVDEENWECVPLRGPDGAVISQIRMRDGNLHQFYWGEERAFRVRWFRAPWIR